MHKNNPAIYECPKGKQTLHTWKRRSDGTAICKHCQLVLSKEDADDAFLDVS